MFGSHGSYEWLVTDRQFDLLEVCPEIVLGKYVAITSIDGGEFVPTPEEEALGWRSRNKIAYSPRIENIDDVAREGWDEWFIFDSPTDLGESHIGQNVFEVPHEPGHLSVFVNYRLALHLPNLKDLAELFWQQMERIRPESYVGDNDYLNFVTSNKILFARVRIVVEALRES